MLYSSSSIRYVPIPDVGAFSRERERETLCHSVQSASRKAVRRSLACCYSTVSLLLQDSKGLLFFPCHTRHTASPPPPHCSISISSLGFWLAKLQRWYYSSSRKEGENSPSGERGGGRAGGRHISSSVASVRISLKLNPFVMKASLTASPTTGG